MVPAGRFGGRCRMRTQGISSCITPTASYERSARSRRGGDAPRPSELSGDWVEGDGWLVRSEYRQLEQAVALSEIPRTGASLSRAVYEARVGTAGILVSTLRSLRQSTRERLPAARCRRHQLTGRRTKRDLLCRAFVRGNRSCHRPSRASNLAAQSSALSRLAEDPRVCRAGWRKRQWQDVAR